MRDPSLNETIQIRYQNVLAVSQNCLAVCQGFVPQVGRASLRKEVVLRDTIGVVFLRRRQFAYHYAGVFLVFLGKV